MSSLTPNREKRRKIVLLRGLLLVAVGGLLLDSSGFDPGLAPPERFAAIWANIYDHLSAEPARARFLLQVDASPYAAVAHDRAMQRPDDELTIAMADVAQLLVDLPPILVFELAIGPAITSIASGETLTVDQRARLSAACWRAITVPTD